MGFRGRQIATLTFVAAAVALATSIVSTALLARTMVSDARDGAELLARALYYQASRVMRQQSIAGLREALASDEALRSYSDAVVGYSPTILYVAISDADDVLIFHSDPVRQESVLGPRASLQEFSERSALAQFWALSRAQGALVVDLPFSVEGDEPFGTFHVAVSAVLLKRALFGTVGVNALLASSAVLIAFVGSFYIANRLLAPLVALREQLARIDMGEDQPPLDLRTEADVGRIAEFFDSLGQRMAADHQLDETGLSLNTLLTGLSDAVILLGADRTILSLNDSARRMFDDRTGLPGGRLDELLALDHPLRELVDEALEHGKAGAIRPVPVAGESEPAEYLLSANLLRQSDRTSGVLVTARDMQRVSRLASQISYAQKLSSLGRLTSGVAHELRNPLNAMTMHLSILRKKIDSGSPEAGRHVEVLEEELRRLDRVVKGFLEFSRPEEIELQRMGVEDVLQTAVNRVRPIAEPGGVTLNFEADPGLPRIIANFHLLEQAFVNLLTNSCEAMPDGGRVDVRAAAAEGSVVVTVEDTGAGIPREALSKIFNLYFTTKEDGSGVGLSLVYRIVQLHGGEIEVDSEPGRGTRFTITMLEGAV